MFELGIQKNWIDALYARSSVRQYTGAPDIGLPSASTAFTFRVPKS